MNKIMSAHAVGALGAVVAILVLLQCAEAQKPHVVGEDQGWRIPSDPSFYKNWAKTQNFSVGDILMFNFQTGQHNVVEVPKESYDSCSENDSKSTNSTGPANITLHRAEKHYFICSFGNGAHCKGGQKLAIDVSLSPAGSPTYPDSPPPPPPPPSSAPVSSATSAFASFLLLSFSSFMFVMF